MKKIIYTPKDESLKGTIEISVPSTRQRLRYLKECNFMLDDKGQTVASGDIGSLEKVFVITAKHILSVDIKSEDSTFKSFDELAEDSECDDLCQDLFKVVMQGGLSEV